MERQFKCKFSVTGWDFDQSSCTLFSENCDTKVRFTDHPATTITFTGTWNTQENSKGRCESTECTLQNQIILGIYVMHFLNHCLLQILKGFGKKFKVLLLQSKTVIKFEIQLLCD